MTTASNFMQAPQLQRRLPPFWEAILNRLHEGDGGFGLDLPFSSGANQGANGTEGERLLIRDFRIKESDHILVEGNEGVALAAYLAKRFNSQLSICLRAPAIGEPPIVDVAEYPPNNARRIYGLAGDTDASPFDRVFSSGFQAEAPDLSRYFGEVMSLLKAGGSWWMLSVFNQTPIHSNDPPQQVKHLYWKRVLKELARAGFDQVFCADCAPVGKQLAWTFIRDHLQQSLSGAAETVKWQSPCLESERSEDPLLEVCNQLIHGDLCFRLLGGRKPPASED